MKAGMSGILMISTHLFMIVMSWHTTITIYTTFTVYNRKFKEIHKVEFNLKTNSQINFNLILSAKINNAN